MSHMPIVFDNVTPPRRGTEEIPNPSVPTAKEELRGVAMVEENRTSSPWRSVADDMHRCWLPVCGDVVRALHSDAMFQNQLKPMEGERDPGQRDDGFLSHPRQ